jgi:hypothetical protein
VRETVVVDIGVPSGRDGVDDDGAVPPLPGTRERDHEPVGKPLPEDPAATRERIQAVILAFRGGLVPLDS